MNKWERAYQKQNITIEKNQLKILDCLRSIYPDIMKSTKLGQKTGLSRKTIIKHGKELKEKGLVRRVGGGKKAKYQITELALGNMPQTRGQLFQSIAFDRIISGNINHALSGKLNISTLSTKIAFYITYVLTEAMRPTLNKNNPYPGRIKDILVKEWITNAIGTERILWEFVKLPVVQKGLRRYGKNAYSDDSPKWSLYEMDNVDVFDELREICKSLDPDAFEELEKIRIEKMPLLVNDKVRISQKKEIEKNFLIHPEMARKLFY